MVHKKSSTNDIGVRVATAMQQLGIEGLPRNYELVYEAYAGTNPDLVRDFIALGKYKTQAALDELGRKYLPHQHEASVLQRSAGVVRDEMSNFMALLDEEKTSLTDYGRLIGEASQAIVGADGGPATALGASIEALRRATERRATENAAMTASVSAHAEALDGLARELAEFEANKFLDVATGLGNRRAFNKAVARAYADLDEPDACAVVIAEVDAAKRFSPRQMEALGPYLVGHFGSLIRQAFPSGDIAARFDGLRFGFLFQTGDESQVLRLLVLLRSAFQAAALRHPETGRGLGTLSFSAGLCMTEHAGNAFDLLNLGEKALAQAIAEGGDRVVVHREKAASRGKDWMLYRAS
ncbi:diguanylate cyclase [Rhizobium sp. TRM95111]|uniref:diguanylate cyclase domain-containing protein n=1 Tax=Rhizobium alarense TaxID=2846851 RepID=UPI001F174E17|nr:diguanylate cyclase [Rhizobium alarense]MCF3640644.1 diguanylate cyclase [Rhizobium alarense]